MRLHRFIRELPVGTITDGHHFSIADTELAHQIKNVLRLTVGEHCVVADNHDNEANVTITEITPSSVSFEVGTAQTSAIARKQINLYVALPKRDLFEQIVSMATQLGVATITPILCERTVKTGINEERIHRIANEAAETANRGSLPVLGTTLTFDQALKNIQQQNDTTRAMIVCDGSGEYISQLLTSTKDSTSYDVFIGPEGGFSVDEIATAKARNAHIVSLGPLTLRIETAAVAILASLLSQ